MWQPAERYPDPAIEILDPSFERYRIFNAAVERLHTGCRWTEGPVWFGDARFRFIARRRATPTVIRATGRDASSPVSMAGGASPAPRSTAGSPFSPTGSKVAD